MEMLIVLGIIAGIMVALVIYHILAMLTQSEWAALAIMVILIVATIGLIQSFT